MLIDVAEVEDVDTLSAFLPFHLLTFLPFSIPFLWVNVLL